MLDNGLEQLIVLLPLLIIYSVAYPVYIARVYRLIHGWRLYNVFINTMLGLTGVFVGFKLHYNELLIISATYTLILNIVQLRGISLKTHIVVVETYTYIFIAYLLIKILA